MSVHLYIAWFTVYQSNQSVDDLPSRNVDAWFTVYKSNQSVDDLPSRSVDAWFTVYKSNQSVDDLLVEMLMLLLITQFTNS